MEDQLIQSDGWMNTSWGRLIGAGYDTAIGSGVHNPYGTTTTSSTGTWGNERYQKAPQPQVPQITRKKEKRSMDSLIAHYYARKQKG